MANDARALAWEILRRVDETAAFADALVGDRLNKSHLDRRDQALLTQLVYGTLTWRGFLDAAIESFSGRPIAQLEPPVRTLLELALFQLFKLDRVPAHAAVHQAVELAKTYKGGRAAKLVNAVLRRAAAEGPGGVTLPDRERDLAAHLSVRYSHPRWLVDRWVAGLGSQEAEALLQANNEPAPTVLRVNRRRASRERVVEVLQRAGVRAAPAARAVDAIVVEGASPWQLNGFGEGLFSIQSEASQLVTALLAAQPGERVLDACAGVGGKATYLAELMDDRGEVVAFDLHRRNLRRLQDEARRLGLSCLSPVIADATRPPQRAGEQFDRILLDAPCSGLGTLRQHPEIRWRRTPSDLARSAALQRRLLTALLDHLRPGGVLVYAVCTIAPEENEDIVTAVLAERSDIERKDPRDVLPSVAHDIIDDRAAVRSTPYQHGLDGFYAVQLKRSRA